MSGRSCVTTVYTPFLHLTLCDMTVIHVFCRLLMATYSEIHTSVGLLHPSNLKVPHVIMTSKKTNKLKYSVVSTSSPELRLKGALFNVYQTNSFALLLLTRIPRAVFSTNHESLLHQTRQFAAVKFEQVCVSSFAEVWAATGANTWGSTRPNVQTWVHVTCYT